VWLGSVVCTHLSVHGWVRNGACCVQVLDLRSNTKHCSSAAGPRTVCWVLWERLCLGCCSCRVCCLGQVAFMHLCLCSCSL
jgi:hypothetical protein